MKGVEGSISRSAVRSFCDSQVSVLTLFGELFFYLPFRQLRMKGVILTKLKLPQKETRRRQRDLAKVLKIL